MRIETDRLCIRQINEEDHDRMFLVWTELPHLNAMV